MKKLNLAILCGGQSPEHQVSLQSAKNIIEAIDKEKYKIILIGINKKGEWFNYEKDNFLDFPNDPEKIKLKNNGQRVNLILGEKKELYFLNNPQKKEIIDVAFPILHGTFGEDGTIQGLLKLANIPFVGPNLLSSAIAMDKYIAKKLLKENGLLVADFLVFHKNEKNKISFSKIKEKLGLPFFIKPVNAGSSIGVSKIEDEKKFQKGIKEAFKNDDKILIEKAIEGRELECAILGNENLIPSEIGEILAQKDFYSYSAKYIDQNGAILKMPAKLPQKIKEEAQKIAQKAFRTLNCSGMARVDFFLDKNNKIIINEINTIPGFTKNSMYPKLLELSGIKYKNLLDKLINLAIEKKIKNNNLAK